MLLWDSKSNLWCYPPIRPLDIDTEDVKGTTHLSIEAQEQIHTDANDIESRLTHVPNEEHTNKIIIYTAYPSSCDRIEAVSNVLHC